MLEKLSAIQVYEVGKRLQIELDRMQGYLQQTEKVNEYGYFSDGIVELVFDVPD